MASCGRTSECDFFIGYWILDSKRQVQEKLVAVAVRKC